MKHATVRAALSLLFVVLILGFLAAQPPSESSSSSSSASQPPSAKQQPSHNPDTVVGEELAGAANGDTGEKEENAQLKYSKNVVRWGHFVGLSPRASYTVYWFLNFVLLVLFFAYFLRKLSVSKMFRDRTAAIQKGIREAQAASAEAARRLTDIEARLAKLDTEVAQIRASAESEAAAEEGRIRQAAEEDKRKVLDSVGTEINAIARNARRELKTFAATLAVDLASRNIKVDDHTDQALLHDFVGQLGKDGK